MIHASLVIEHGRRDCRGGMAFDDCPYSEPQAPIIVNGFHGSRCIGKVRIGLDYKNLWEIGWNIQDLINVRSAPIPARA